MTISKKRLAEIAAIARRGHRHLGYSRGRRRILQEGEAHRAGPVCPFRSECASGWQLDKEVRRTLRFRHLRPQRQLDQGQRARHAADAGARLREARRAIPADQVAAGLGQEPGADVHRARQAPQSGAPAGDHRRAGESDRRELPRRAAEPSSASGRTGPSRRNGTSAMRPARTMAARSIRSAPSWKATTRCWSAPMRPSASPWTSSGSRRSTTG